MCQAYQPDKMKRQAYHLLTPYNPDHTGSVIQGRKPGQLTEASRKGLSPVQHRTKSFV